MPTTELKKTTVPLIIAYCPPLARAGNDLETNNSEYFIVRSQTDADKLKTCYTFKGELVIYGTNASAPLIIDGPREIQEMAIAPISTTDTPLLTSISIKTLTTITDRAEIRMGWPDWTSPTPAQSHITLLGFPALKVARWLYVHSLAPSVQTFNHHLLERVQTLWFCGGDNLHTINAPRLSSVSGIKLMHLPSITTTRKFFTSLKGLVQYLEIWNMRGLTSIEFPEIEVLSSLGVWENLNLKTLTFPSLTLVTELHDRGRGSIAINDNNYAFHLSLPKLKSVTGSVSLAGLRGIDIPELQRVGENPRWSAPAGGLYIGAGDSDWYFRWTNCRPVYLTSFSAPKLRNVVGRIAFDSAPKLSNISFPSLKRAGKLG